ncbi:hypothetical protein SELMODRAFT_414135 [Selaginella moellendorffii]|uniref:Endonuclease/exonuclease/phosphatase domain-containing protein n=1 Tax=Selaginella moellendorffii TaxID=88036 RepID=D8RRR6_SELML|nr:hypothetical protein SELMODRAFT_414135 [Selaginella moellendorffii]
MGCFEGHGSCQKLHQASLLECRNVASTQIRKEQLTFGRDSKWIAPRVSYRWRSSKGGVPSLISRSTQVLHISRCNHMGEMRLGTMDKARSSPPRRLPTGIDDWILAGDFNFVDHEEDKRGGIIQDRRTRVERLAWNSFLLEIATCDTYEIPGFVTHEPRFTWQEHQHRGIQCRLDRFYVTMDLCMQGGKLDIDNTYTDFSDHHPIRLTLPFRISRGPRKPVAIPKKFFEEQTNNNWAHEQWEKHKGNLHSTLRIAQEAQAKIQKDKRGVFNTVQKVRRILTSINTNLRSNPDDPWLQAQKIQVKCQLERIEADKMEAFLKVGHIRWHASELALNREFYRSIRSKVVSPPMFGLKDEQRHLHTKIDDMHNMAEHYYSQFFKEEPWDELAPPNSRSKRIHLGSEGIVSGPPGPIGMMAAQPTILFAPLQG